MPDRKSISAIYDQNIDLLQLFILQKIIVWFESPTLGF